MKSRLTIVFALIIAVMAFSGGPAYAAKAHLTAVDNGVAFRFYNGNSSGNVTVTIVSSGAGSNLVTNQTSATTIDGSGADPDTMAEFLADLAACTNDSGNATISVDSDASLDADSTDGELLDGTYTATPGTWASVYWDSSENEQLDCYIPPESNYGFTISHIIGNPQGTGPCTLSIYRNQVLIYQGVLEQPYDLASDNTVTALSNYIESLPLWVNVPIERGEGVFLRATRTTMTGGNIGFIAE